jgi:NADPH-dependent 2,4-dienoyl-CoA reductase/sulfur reductase-like enzyme/nitrite reductase/ring-hydroxylating ferredoxin subunit
MSKEIAVAWATDLENGEMREVSAEGTSILLVRVDDEYRAFGAHCPHYGAPLAEGVLDDGRIVCPWHHACFNAVNGDLEEPPALDGLACYDVKVRNNQIMICLPERVAGNRVSIARSATRDERSFVILGGGAAGYMAAQTLREDHFTGRVTLITREDRPPYDRPNLSKDYLAGEAEPEWMPLRSAADLDRRGIEVLYEREAASVDPRSNEITFGDGERMRYDSLLIATGGIPRRLPFQRDGQQNVFVLRSFSDADAIIAAAEKGKHAAVIGASFIGMEVACSLRKRGCEVTVISPDNVPFSKVLGDRIGKYLKDLHEENGVNFIVNAHVKDLAGTPQVSAVSLDNNDEIAVDLVVVGIGVRPATDCLQGVELHEDGGVITDRFLRVQESLYAAGDIAHVPDPRTGDLVRIEHWRTALQQGRTAAHNMMGRQLAFTGVPFFWTVQFDAKLRYVGHAPGWDKMIFHGEVEKSDFLAFYIKNDQILAVAGMNRDRDLAMWEERMRLDKMPSPDGLRNLSSNNFNDADASAPGRGAKYLERSSTR